MSAQFLELYNEDILDLFDNASCSVSKSTNGPVGGLGKRSTSAGTNTGIRIHEDANGNIYTVSRGLRKLDGQTGFQKNCKTPFFSRYSNFLLMGDWNWSKNYPVFFFLKNLNKYGR